MVTVLRRFLSGLAILPLAAEPWHKLSCDLSGLVSFSTHLSSQNHFYIVYFSILSRAVDMCMTLGKTTARWHMWGVADGYGTHLMVPHSESEGALCGQVSAWRVNIL
jgi:hypothetical protein